MSSPVTPADAAATVPNPSSSLCETFTKSNLQLPVDWAAFIAWMLDANGDFSAAFKAMLSAAVLPVGSVILSGNGSVPDGFLLCNGQAVSRTTYATLFGIIGTTFGSGDGTTTFNVPDFRDRYPRGVGTATSIGDKTADGYSPDVTLDEDNIPKHAHYIGVGSAVGVTVDSEAGRQYTDGSEIKYDVQVTDTAVLSRDYGPGTPVSQVDVTCPEPKNIVVNFFIKY